MPSGAPGWGEPRWPPVVAALVALGVPLLVPESLTFGRSWLMPAVGGAFALAVLLAGSHRRAAILVIALTLVLAVGSAWMTVRLLSDLIRGGPTTASATTLLSAGALIWLSNAVVFAFLYWELDAGGPIARATGLPRPDGFAFPQHMNPEISPPAWRPRFVDYLYVGITNASAFSPTDAMPLRAWAKLTMALQALLSVAILSLVIARAVNVMS